MSTGRTVIAVAVIVGHVLVLYGVAALAAVGRQRVIETASEPIVVTLIAASRGPAQPAAQSTPEPAAPHPQEKLQPHAKPQQPPPQAKSLAKPHPLNAAWRSS